MLKSDETEDPQVLLTALNIFREQCAVAAENGAGGDQLGAEPQRVW